MIGLVLAGLYALYLWLKDRAPDLIFKQATNFLFWWYVVTTSFFSILLFLVFAGMGVGAGAEMGHLLDLLIGGALGGAVGLIVMTLVILFSLLAIIGAHLLRTAVSEGNGGFQWNKKRLVVGVILLFISLMFVGR